MSGIDKFGTTKIAWTYFLALPCWDMDKKSENFKAQFFGPKKRFSWPHIFQFLCSKTQKKSIYPRNVWYWMTGVEVKMRTQKRQPVRRPLQPLQEVRRVTLSDLDPVRGPQVNPPPIKQPPPLKAFHFYLRFSPQLLFFNPVRLFVTKMAHFSDRRFGQVPSFSPPVQNSPVNPPPPK